MKYMGENMRSVGHIEQTVQCVVQGVSQGTVHLTATVVRNLYTNFNVDCVASSKTYRRLTGKDPPKPPDEGYDDDGNDACSLTSSLPDCQTNLVTKKWLADQSQDLGEEEDEEDVKVEEDKAIGCDARPPDPPLEAEPSTPPTPTPRKTKTKSSFRMTTAGPNLGSFEMESDDEEDDHDPQAPCYRHNLAGCGQCDTERYIRLAIMRGEMSRPEEIYNDYVYDEEELFCKTCFLGGISPKVVSNHKEGCPTCPSMTPEEKEAKHGRFWKKQAEMIIKTRFSREQERKRR